MTIKRGVYKHNDRGDFLLVFKDNHASVTRNIIINNGPNSLKLGSLKDEGLKRVLSSKYTFLLESDDLMMILTKLADYKEKQNE